MIVEIDEFFAELISNLNSQTTNQGVVLTLVRQLNASLSPDNQCDAVLTIVRALVRQVNEMAEIHNQPGALAVMVDENRKICGFCEYSPEQIDEVPTTCIVELPINIRTYDSDGSILDSL